jgi:hypothetical protein
MKTVNIIRREKTRLKKGMNAQIKILTVKGPPDTLKELMPGIPDIERSLFVRKTVLIEGNKPEQELFDVSVELR